MKKQKLKAVDFFCSGGGMSYGLKKAGIQILAGVDIDLSCKATYEKNIPESKFLNYDITQFSPEKLSELIDLKKNDDNMIFVGCSPCQYWTIINTDKTKSKKSKNLLLDFYNFVEYFNPGFVMVENVPGILSNKEKSGFDKFENQMVEKGYKLSYKVVNLNHYGVPQSRKRFSFLATRVHKNAIFPNPDKNKRPIVKDFIGISNGFPKVKAGHKDNSDFIHTVAGLKEINIQRLKLTKKNGGSREDWANTELQLETYKKRSNNSFKDTYGRMYWDKPAPTITTKFFSISNGRFGHPEENRAISLREGATLQTFPKSFIFVTKSIGQTARIIGNAVPPEYAKRLGELIINS